MLATAKVFPNIPANNNNETNTDIVAATRDARDDVFFILIHPSANSSN
jgi:hypothetical protein